MSKIMTRMGDGFCVELSEKELMQDIEDGTGDAADRAKIPVLSDDERKAFIAATKPVYDKWIPKIGKALHEKAKADMGN